MPCGGAAVSPPFRRRGAPMSRWPWPLRGWPRRPVPRRWFVLPGRCWRRRRAGRAAGRDAGRIGLPDGAAYGATKAALASLTQGWTAEYSPRGVRVNAVAPGPIYTRPEARQLFDSLGATTALNRGRRARRDRRGRRLPRLPPGQLRHRRRRRGRRRPHRHLTLPAATPPGLSANAPAPGKLWRS